jgi:CHAD domain-containing protein
MTATLNNGTPPDPDLRRDTPAGKVVLAYLRGQGAALEALDPLVRRDEPDSVHQMRIAARRVRSTIRTFGQVLHPSGAERLAGELKWLAAVLGRARDGEVLTGHLRASLDGTAQEQVIGPVVARVQGHYSSARAAAQAELLTALDSERYAALRGDLHQLMTQPPLGPQAEMAAEDVLPKAVRHAYRRLRKRMGRADLTPDGKRKDAALHHARKAARRTRYAGEVAAPVLGKGARRFTKQMKAVQSVLGDHHDTVIARDAARELGIRAHLEGENAFTYGLLHERGTHRRDELAASAHRTWHKASRRRYRHWLS